MNFKSLLIFIWDFGWRTLVLELRKRWSGVSDLMQWLWGAYIGDAASKEQSWMTYLELIPVGHINKIYCPFHQRFKTNEKRREKKKEKQWRSCLGEILIPPGSWLLELKYVLRVAYSAGKKKNVFCFSTASFKPTNLVRIWTEVLISQSEVWDPFTLGI